VISLKAKPTFAKVVDIPVPGEDVPLKLRMEFKHMSKDAFKAWSDPERIAQRVAQGTTDAQIVMECASAWYDVDQPFTEAALNDFFQDYHAAAYAITTAYMTELGKVRSGN
jgi:hypothetical protein